MSQPGNAYIDARNDLHARIEPEIAGIRERYRNDAGLRRAFVALVCMRRRQERLLLWSYFNAAEPNRTVIRPAEGDNGTVTS